MILNVALLPDDDTNSALARAASVLDARRADFSVLDKDVIAHLTLYMTYFRDSVAVSEAVAALATNVLPFWVEACAISRSAYGYVEVGYTGTTRLRRLQRSLIGALKTLRETPSSPPTRRFPPLQLASYNRYGYQFVGDAYRPHVTLARFATETSVSVPDIDLATLSFTAGQLAILESDELGVGRRVVDCISLVRS
jgi:hypothetical protein